MNKNHGKQYTVPPKKSMEPENGGPPEKETLSQNHSLISLSPGEQNLQNLRGPM